MPTFDCFDCNYKKTVGVDLAGRRVKCPKCNSVGRVPAQDPKKTKPKPRPESHSWYRYVDTFFGDKMVGPVSEPDFLEHAFEGDVSYDSLVCSPTRTKNTWVKAKQHDQVATAIDQGSHHRINLEEQEKIRKHEEKAMLRREEAKANRAQEALRQKRVAQERQARLEAQPTYRHVKDVVAIKDELNEILDNPHPKNAKLQRVRMIEQELAQVKRVLNHEMKEIRAKSNYDNGHVGATGALILSALGNRGHARSHRASARRSNRQRKERKLRPYDELKLIVNQLQIFADKVKHSVSMTPVPVSSPPTGEEVIEDLLDDKPVDDPNPEDLEYRKRLTRDFDNLVFDVLCCFMVCDGHASEEEHTIIVGLMERLSKEYFGSDISHRIDQFLNRVLDLGFEKVKDETFDRLYEFFDVGFCLQPLMKSVVLVIKADGKLSKSEHALLEEFHRIVH